MVDGETYFVGKDVASALGYKNSMDALMRHVDNEDKHKPLTDDELVERMTEKGYKVARRTIAKYRDQLGIPKARLRKEL